MHTHIRLAHVISPVRATFSDVWQIKIRAGLCSVPGSKQRVWTGPGGEVNSKHSSCKTWRA